jgi:hypothetical protein
VTSIDNNTTAELQYNLQAYYQLIKDFFGYSYRSYFGILILKKSFPKDQDELSKLNILPKFAQVTINIYFRVLAKVFRPSSKLSNSCIYCCIQNKIKYK